jgi:hypothetical protein
MRTAIVIFCVGLLSGLTLAADPTKDPGGWAEVKLGMTPEEVLAALGTDGYLDDDSKQQEPFNLDQTVDLPAALAFAKQVIASEKKDAATASPGVLEASKALLSETRSATWAYATVSQPGPNLTTQFDPRSIRRLSGILEQITSSGAKGTAAYARGLHIKTGSKVTQIGEQSLDDKSKQRLQKIEQAVADLAAAIKQATDHKKGDADREPVDASRVRARPVSIRGIKLDPTFDFAANRLTKVTMSQGYMGENWANFDERGMQQTLCDALAEKYGPPDQKNQKANSFEFVWKFPTTIIRCVSSRISIPDSGLVRKGVRVVYESAHAERVDDSDKL